MQTFAHSQKERIIQVPEMFKASSRSFTFYWKFYNNGVTKLRKMYVDSDLGMMTNCLMTKLPVVQFQLDFYIFQWTSLKGYFVVIAQDEKPWLIELSFTWAACWQKRCCKQSNGEIGFSILFLSTLLLINLQTHHFRCRDLNPQPLDKLRKGEGKKLIHITPALG